MFNVIICVVLFVKPINHILLVRYADFRQGSEPLIKKGFQQLGKLFTVFNSEHAAFCFVFGITRHIPLLAV